MEKMIQDIIISPIITESSMDMMQNKKYVFKVMRSATKPEIAEAVEEVFDVKDAKVNTMNCKGHLRRYGRYEGYTPSWKTAIVTLTEDSKTIAFFDGLN